MKVHLVNSYTQEDAYKKNTSIQNSTKTGYSDSTEFPVKEIIKRTHELSTSSVSGFSVDVLDGIDKTKVSFIHIDIYDISDDIYTNIVHRFNLKEINSTVVLVERKVSQFSLINLEDGIDNDLTIDSIVLPADTKVILSIIIGLK